jgi:hypothetical protein
MAISIPSPAQHNPAASAAHPSPSRCQARRCESETGPGATSARSQGPHPVDTVHIPNAAQSALRKATETQVQTPKEPRGGDRQAQRLLAKETAAKKA